MKVRVDEDLCQGHTLCQIAAASVFKLRAEDGHAYVEGDEVPPGMDEAVRMAAASCPENAIFYSES